MNEIDLWTGEIHVGDSYDVLQSMPSESIDMCVTSPPYWGHRDYGEIGQLGLEEDPSEYVDKLVEIFGEVKRVLKPTGTLWLNIGDTYNAGRNGGHAGGSKQNHEKYPDKSGVNAPNLKKKDLVGIPWRLAFALQDDGWFLRNDIIWYKPSTMPESVTDRCTTTHEHIFLLSKNRFYYFDQEVIREPCKSADPSDEAYRPKYEERQKNGERFEGDGKYGSDAFQSIPMNGKNKRDVWEISTARFSDAHFAVFPPQIPENCIKAGCPRNVCVNCGTPYERMVETDSPSKLYGDDKDMNWSNDVGHATSNPQSSESLHREEGGVYHSGVFKGWRKNCECETYETEVGVVLDPFMGSGTTGMVSQALGMRWIGIDIAANYAGMAEERIENSDWRPDEGKEWDDSDRVPVDILGDVDGIGDVTMDNVKERQESISLGSLMDVDGVGEKTVERVWEYFKDLSKNEDLLDYGGGGDK